MTDTRSMPLLAPLDRADLQQRGLLRQGPSPGFLQLHKRRLNKSSDEEHRNIPLVIPPNSTIDAFIIIPDVLVSPETLIHIGLSASKVDELWTQWTTWPTYGPRREVDPDDGGLHVSFLDFVLGNTVKNATDAEGDEVAAWFVCMDECGISSDTQLAIMDPKFTYLRLSHSCLHWVRDTIEMRFAGLQDIERASRLREMQLQRTTSRPRGSQAHEARTYEASGSRGQDDMTSSTASNSNVPGGERRSISGMQQQQSMAGMSVDVWGADSATAACNAPGYMVLYKGIDQARITGLFAEDGTLSNTETLLSRPPSDFSIRSSLYYFAADVKVAEYYAAFAKRRSNAESIVIIVLQIPNAAIESLSEPQICRLFWPSNNWKDLVWRSRTGKRLPTHLRHFRDAILIIGSLARRPDSAYSNLNSFEEITDSFLFRLGPDGGPGTGNVATQFVFNGQEEGSEWLIENVAQNIMVFPYPATALDSWLSDH